MKKKRKKVLAHLQVYEKFEKAQINWLALHGH
jgi:hypothetical protein